MNENKNEFVDAIKNLSKAITNFKMQFKTTDKEMMLEAVDIIRTVSDHQRGLKKIIGRLLNKVSYMYYKILR